MRKTTWIVSGLMALGLTAAQAQEEGGGGFKHTMSLGATLTDGNSETLTANASWLSEGEKDQLGSVRLGLEGNYGETTADGVDETTVENAKAFANAKKTLSEKTFVYTDATVTHDEIAAVDYRAILSAGPGAYLMKDDAASLFVEVGPAYVWEEVDGVSDDYLSLRVAQRYDRALSETAKVWQSLEYLPEVDDFDAYLLNAEIGVEAALNARWNIRLVAQSKYNSTPAADLEKNDLSLIAGLSLSL
jgi:putative salt-induced outer membrane protein YdiY